MHTTSFGPELTSISFGCQEEVNMNLKNTRAYGSQFSGEKKRFENPIFGCQDIKQKRSLIFL